MPRKTFTVTLSGAMSIDKVEDVLSWEVKGYPGSTYIVLTFANGSEVWVNDYGLKCFSVTPSGVVEPQVLAP